MVDDRSFRDLATLAVIAETGGFAAAARELGLTRAAVSKRIADLEDHLGVRLLHRTTRKVSLTEIGLVVVDRARRMRAEAQEAFDLARGESDAPTGLLRVTAPVGLGQRLVAPVLANFALRHPKISVELILDDKPVDLVGRSIDVAIRAGKLKDSSLRARKLGPLTLLICASARYVQSRGEPRSPKELLEHDWVVLTPMGRPQRVVLDGPDGRTTLRLNGRLAADDGEVVRQWVDSGLGIALLPRFWIEADLAEGRLRWLLRHHRVQGGALYALHPYHNKVPVKVSAFVQALLQLSAGF